MCSCGTVYAGRDTILLGALLAWATCLLHGIQLLMCQPQAHCAIASACTLRYCLCMLRQSLLRVCAMPACHVLCCAISSSFAVCVTECIRCACCCCLWCFFSRWDKTRLLLDPRAPLVAGRRRWATRDEREEFELNVSFCSFVFVWLEILSFWLENLNHLYAFEGLSAMSVEQHQLVSIRACIRHCFGS